MALSGSLTIGPDSSGRILAIENGIVVDRPVAGAPVLACPEGKIRPGNVCAHTHLYSGLVPYDMPPTVPAPETFLEILQRKWWKMDRALDGQSLRAAARDYVADALLSGTTAIIDHHESPSLIEGSLSILADACTDLGIRVLLCYGATERNGGLDEAMRGLDECATISSTPLVRGLIGLHASFTVSDETIREAGMRARALATVLHVHVAEAQSDIEDARKRGYDGPLERLIALDALVPGSIVVHGTHLTPDQVRRVDAMGCWLVHNPRSNEGNGVGYASSLSFSQHVALGTDGWNADMDEEQRALERLAKANGDTNVAGRLEAGHGLIGERFGLKETPLQPGAPGDAVVETGGNVAHVVVNGRIVVKDGTLTAADTGTIRQEARMEAGCLWKRMKAL